VGSTLAAALPALAAVWLTVLHVRDGYAWTDYRGMLVVVVVMVLSTVPAWVTARRSARPPGAPGRGR
jgi:hypothetical protein